MPVVLESSSTMGLASGMGPLQAVVEQQLTSLDDTDTYASVWADALARHQNDGSASSSFLWGGRGRGGRGLARRTFQPRDIVVEDVRLEFAGIDTNQTQLPSKVLLDGATLKLLSGHVYALIGRNGVGKSTLLRRMQAGKIPGFPPHIATLYIPQELPTPQEGSSALELVQSHFISFSKSTSTSLQYQMELLEKEWGELDDGNEGTMEALCEELSNLQDAIDEARQDGEQSNASLLEQANDALTFLDISPEISDVPYTELSPGQRKKVALAVAVLCASTSSPSQQLLLCLDEPTNYLDVAGLIKLRQFLLQDAQNRTVLLVSHDTDLLNDVATDTIIFSHVQKTLLYFPGAYWDFPRQWGQQQLHLLRQQVSLDRKRQQMVQTIHYLQDQPAPKRGGNKKKGKMIAAQKKKLNRQGIEKNEVGHRWTQQKAGTGIKPGALNGIDASTRRDLSTVELLKLAEASVRPPPDKAVQFVFRDTKCTWGEPLIMAMDVGHGYGPFPVETEKTTTHRDSQAEFVITRRKGFLFDCVDLCINEGRKYCLLGKNASGKSSLLRLLAKQEEPLEGSIHHAHRVQIGYFGQETMDQLLKDASSDPGVAVTALSYLANRFPNKTDKDLRGSLTDFGLSPEQATTDIRFLSGGERCRLCLASLMLENPHVLCLDNPTTNLDVESVEALVHGLLNWKDGTVVMVSHDSNLIRQLDADCAVLMEEEGKLRRIDGSIDDYLRAFKY